MKLLFDANLSPELAKIFSKAYPKSSHVFHFGLEKDDKLIWEFARLNDFVIVTKDNDFVNLSNIFGSPPKVIFIKRENCPTKTIESILKLHREAIESFIQEDKDLGLLIIR